jgi:hypothetical protein
VAVEQKKNNRGYKNNARRVASTILRNEKRNYLKAKMNELEGNSKTKVLQ